MRLLVTGTACVTALLAGCAAPTRVPLLRAAGIPITLTPTRSVAMEVVTRGTAVRDPLPVDGSNVVYGDVEAALGLAVSSAVVPWASERKATGPHAGEGLELLVEMTQAQADHHDGRLIVTFGVRATLRTRAGGRYIAQTQGSCRQAGVVDAEQGGPVVYACLSRIGRDLAGWLGAVDG